MLQRGGEIRHLCSMKKLFYVMLALVGLVSCEEISAPWDIIVDWAPVELTIEAYDAEGNSIISPEMPGMTLTFKGETYTVKDGTNPSEGEMQTKALPAIFYGLVARPVQGDQGEIVGYILHFGEIDGAADMDEDLVLNWPDGSTDTIHYHCGNHREWPSPKCDRSWKLNGKRQDRSVFVFYNKSLPVE